MHMFETEKGDIWVCNYCADEKSDIIEKEEWEWIFEKEDPILRCSQCGHGDYDYDDD